MTTYRWNLHSMTTCRGDATEPIVAIEVIVRPNHNNNRPFASYNRSIETEQRPSDVTCLATWWWCGVLQRSDSSIKWVASFSVYCCMPLHVDKIRPLLLHPNLVLAVLLTQTTAIKCSFLKAWIVVGCTFQLNEWGLVCDILQLPELPATPLLTSPFSGPFLVLLDLLVHILCYAL